MALALFDRVQETTTTTGTGSITLAGAVPGFQSFAVVGNGNTCYYTIVDNSAWEVGVGTYSTSGPTLARTTILSNSNGNTTAITLAAGTKSVFLTYPASKSVNLNESGNVSALGTVSSGTWQGSTIGVAYGGTGVTTSTGANSVVIRDANGNITVNRLNQELQTITASGGTTVLTAASDFNQQLVGTGGHTFRLPDATTLTDTTAFQFNNNATGTLTIQNNASAVIGTVAPGGAAGIALMSNATVAGTWDVHGYIPENVTWGTNSLALGSTVITGGTWNGGTITSAYGGTGLTTFTAANNALYSTSAGALAAGTLPVLAGGTGATTAAGAQSSLNVPSTTGSGASGTWGISITGSASGSSGSVVNAATFNSSGAGDASGTTFNGSAARTISYNTIGAPSTTGTNASGTWGINVTGTSASISGFNNPTTAPTANTIAYRDSAGDIAAREIILSSALITNVPTVLVGMFPATNQLVRMTPAAVASAIQTGATGTWNISISGNAATATTAANYVPLAGGTMSGNLTVTRILGVNSLVLNTYTTVNPASNVYLYSPPGDRDAWIYLDSADTSSNWGIYHRQIDTAVSGLPANSIGFIGGGTSALQAWISLANGSANFAGALTQGGNQVLHAGNYNSYAPTLTGGGASGTWGINITGNASGSSTSVSATTALGIRNSFSASINTTTPGTTNYGISFDGHGTSDNAAGITWAWSGTNAQAGIYVQSSGAYGTKMYFGTTDSFATGSKTSMSIDHVGVVQIPRNYLQSDSSLRAPIFYDSNDTGYYVDPNGTSVLNQLEFIGANNKYIYINPGNGYEAMVRYNGGSGNTWYVGKRVSTDLVGTADFHFYSQAAGRTVAGVDAAGNTFAYLSSRAPIFYDNDDTAYYVNPNSETRIYLTSVNVGNEAPNSGAANSSNQGLVMRGNYNTNTWAHKFHKYDNGSGVALYVSQTVGAGAWGALQGWGNGIGYTSVIYGTLSTDAEYSPIYYDRDNTGFYVDPASTSNINTLAGNGKTALETADSYLRINQSSSFSSGIWFGSSNRLSSSGYGAWGSNGGTTSSRVWINSGSYNGSNVISLDGSNGVIIAAGDVRAPIFYDSNNTGFYVDPASTSYINGLSVGAQTWRSDITWNNSVNILVSGECSFDVSSGTWQVWDTGNGAPMLTCPYQGQVTIGTAGSRGLYVAGSITASGNVTAYSDERLKKDWAPLASNFVERLANVKSGTYTRIDSDKRQAGSSAQDWQKLLPEVVITNLDDDKTLSLDYGNAALVSAVELAKYVTALEQRISQLEARL